MKEMTATSKKFGDKQNPETKIDVLYNNKSIKAFKVNIKQGRFIVIDYKDRFSKHPDTEVFWESGLIKILPHTSEYKAVDKIITSFIKSLN